MKNNKNFSGMAPPDFNKGQKVRLLKDSSKEPRVIERLYPMSGGYLYEVSGRMGLYGKQEIEAV